MEEKYGKVIINIRQDCINLTHVSPALVKNRSSNVKEFCAVGVGSVITFKTSYETSGDDNSQGNCRSLQRRLILKSPLIDNVYFFRLTESSKHYRKAKNSENSELGEGR